MQILRGHPDASKMAAPKQQVVLPRVRIVRTPTLDTPSGDPGSVPGRSRGRIARRLRRGVRAFCEALRGGPGAALPAAVEPAPAGRCGMLGVWAAPGAAVAVMVAASWRLVLARGQVPGGDMLGHAATARWFKTLNWWEWNGWSDWFFGGQALGVNYPPLSVWWLRLTDPVHGQMAAVAVGLVVLLPWGTLRLARAVGFTVPQQRATVAAMAAFVTVSGPMHWMLPGFHYQPTFFGSWPAMLSAVGALFAAAWAARCSRPLAAGAVVGICGLVNVTTVPGTAVVCAALVAGSAVSWRSGLRWCASAGCAALAVAGWWVVPFLSGWDRLVRWEVPLGVAWDAGGGWQPAVLAVLGGVAVWVWRQRPGPQRRLATVVAVGFVVACVGEFSGYLRVERWMTVPVLITVVVAGSVLGDVSRGVGALLRARCWRIVAGCGWVLLSAAAIWAATIGEYALVPVAAAAPLLWRRWNPVVVAAAAAWAGLLFWVPVQALLLHPQQSHVLQTPTEAVAATDGSASGLVMSRRSYDATLWSSDPESKVRCLSVWDQDWRFVESTQGRLRPTAGMYRETSATAEFLDAERVLGVSLYVRNASGPIRPHWLQAWEQAEKPVLVTPAAAQAFGADWLVVCEPDGEVTVHKITSTKATGVHLVPLPDDDAWHQNAVGWWIAAAGGSVDADTPLPALTNPGVDPQRMPWTQAATAAAAVFEPGSVSLRVSHPGWVWVKVAWDPYWSTDSGAPVLKAGPGQIAVWVEPAGVELRWGIPKAVSVLGAAVAAIAAALAVVVAVRPSRDASSAATRHPEGDAAS